MKKLLKNQDADMKTISGAVGILITLMIAILVLYSIAGAIDGHTIDQNWAHTWTSGVHTNSTVNATHAQNATNASLDQAGTFFTIAPIIVIVMIAVVILKYVGMI